LCRIEFEFTLFDLEYRFDYVSIYDGNSVNSPMVAEFTGSTPNITGYATTRTTFLSPPPPRIVLTHGRPQRR
jgi:hypothetical protein